MGLLEECSLIGCSSEECDKTVGVAVKKYPALTNGLSCGERFVWTRAYDCAGKGQKQQFSKDCMSVVV